MEDELLDRIYEAGAVPELWPQVLDELSQLTGVAGGVLFAVRGDSAHWMSSPAFEDDARGYFENYSGRDDRTARLLGAQHPGFLTDLDVFSRADWEANEIRNEYFVPRGYGWGVATSIMVPTGDLMIFHGEGRLADGPIGPEVVQQLDQLRPHLARAALMSARVAFERARGAVAALNMVGIPAAVLGLRGKLVVANDMFEQLDPATIAIRAGRPTLADPGADALLGTSIDAIDAGRQAAASSIPVPGRGSAGPMVVHLLPVRGVARDIFSGAAAIMLITPVTQRDLPEAAVIQGLFDLTPAEARIARALGGGMTVNQVAASSGASLATVRNQVQSVFAKTGIHRQADLVGLLQGLSQIPSSDPTPSPPPRRK